MRIERAEVLHCDAGWRVWSFLKLSAGGVDGWSEFNESYGSPALGSVILSLCEMIEGDDARAPERITAKLHAITRQAPGGMLQQAIAAIENAVVDLKAKSLGIPVCELLGGPVRDRLRLYWSHCGSYRLRHADAIGKPALASLDDLTELVSEIIDAGFGAMKTNIFVFDQGEPFMFQPGFGKQAGWPELNVDRRLRALIERQMGTMRDAAGARTDLLLDLNFNAKTEGYLQLAHAVEPFDLMWLEIDQYDAAALATIRAGTRTPIASCESLFHRRQFRPFLERQSMDVAIVDIPWNGILEGIKIAAMAEAFETNCAPHNFYGNLSTAMSAHFCAAIQNFRIMEIDIDDVPWKDEVASPPRIEDGPPPYRHRARLGCHHRRGRHSPPSTEPLAQRSCH